MFKKILRGSLLLCIMVLIGACSDYQKLIKSQDYQEKYEMAVFYYNQGDYYKALELFDAVLPFFRGSDKAEELNYYYAYCHYKQGDNLLASHYFKRFTKSFPTSRYAEECQFLSAYCKYLESPSYKLDQTTTYEAINELQLFIDMYPGSERETECTTLIDRLNEKLEKKDFEIARLYLKMEDYNAAITAFNNVLKDFPATRFKEEILFSLAKANYLYAEKSIESKKQERHQNAIEAYDAFVATYPDSPYIKQINTYTKNSRKQLKE
ncbi:MAG: outer membrane protein assembly factor BamD [Bacteroidales bacterium]|nr:outer membrane protein assembly factor BamD [Bacteroidales bacterium]